MSSNRKDYARSASPSINTTRSGSRYVRPFDILRSESGRAIIQRQSDSSQGRESSPAPEDFTGKSDQKKNDSR